MKVFKFGGASLKDAHAIVNMASLVAQHAQEPLLIVVSAMASTTNALERVLADYKINPDNQAELDALTVYHHQLIEQLFDQPQPVMKEVNRMFEELAAELQKPGEEDKRYDQVVSLGEVISSIIAHRYLEQCGLPCSWADARKLIRTDSTFREGIVDWHQTSRNVQALTKSIKNNMIITQGFIGADAHGNTTTLGREGSDFSAAIFASCLEARSVTIWKDVPGVMNADPKRLPAALVFDELPYKEAAEMTYYGASVIHPKTIKPLALKGIPLYVKSFIDPSLPGTKIHDCKIDHLPPMIVIKDNQCLVSCKVTDYTFVNEQQLGTIFHALTELNIKLNVMQNSAISFSFCIDFIESKLNALIEKLHQHFEVYYNTNLTLITIKNYDEQSFEMYRKKPGILMEQSSRSTLQVLVKDM
jgi:aspartate kinase